MVKIEILLVPLLASGFAQSSFAAALIHTYDPGRDKAAQAIQEAYGKVDVLEVIRLEETNLAAIASLELSALESQAVARRNAEIFRLLNETNTLATAFFERSIGERIKQLAGPGPNPRPNEPLIEIDKLNADFDDLAIAKLQFQQRLGIAPPPFDYGLLSIPSAEAWFEQHPPRTPGPPAVYTAYSNACQRIAAQLGRVAGTQGTLAETLRTLSEAQQAAQRQQSAVLEAQAYYEGAVKAYNGAVEAANASGTGRVAAGIQGTGRLLEEVQRALNTVAHSGGNLGKLMAITNELAALDVVIGACGSTNAPPANAMVNDPALRKAVLVGTQLHGVLEQGQALEAAIRRPPLMDLLIRREMLQIQKETLLKAVEREETKVKLLERIWLATVAKYSLLNEIKLLQAQLTPEVLGKTPDQALALRGGGSGAVVVNQALLEYAEVMRVFDYQIKVGEFGLTHLVYQEANGASESAARMWNSLIANPINELVQYHASGIKPEAAADLLIKALGAGAIAWRLR